MNILKYKEFEGTAEVDVERGVCRGKLLFIDDLITYEAESPKQLQAEFEASVDDYLETCRLVGKEPQRPFRGMFNVRVSPALHRQAALRAAREGVALNEVVVRALDTFLNAGSEVPHHMPVVAQGTRPIKTMQAPASTEMRWETWHVH